MDGEFWVARLNAHDASIVWPKIAGFLAPAIQCSEGLMTPEDVRELVTAPLSGTAKAWSLWIIAERDQLLGAWTTRPTYYPRETVLEVVHGGGIGMDDWYGFGLRELEKFARENGMTRIHCAGRKGWSKYGFRSLGIFFERRVA